VENDIFYLELLTAIFNVPLYSSLTCCSLKNNSRQFLILLEVPGQRLQGSGQIKTHVLEFAESSNPLEPVPPSVRLGKCSQQAHAYTYLRVYVCVYICIHILSDYAK